MASVINTNSLSLLTQNNLSKSQASLNTAIQRLYRLRKGEFSQMTQDHSVIQELVSRGLLTIEEARQTVGKNLVTRALGVDAEVTPDVAEQPFEDSDIYLLCSDGLNDDGSSTSIERRSSTNLDLLRCRADSTRGSFG